MLIDFLLIIILYLIGSFPTSHFYGNFFLNKNILLEGSSHSGLSNIYRYLSFYKILMILFFDVVIKGALPSYILSSYLSDLTNYLIALVVGHNFSIFLKFKGGRGLAISLGILLGAKIELFFTVLIIFLILWAIVKFKDSSLPWLVSLIITTITYLYDYHLGNFFFDSEYKNIKLLLFSILLLLIFTRILGKRNYSRINYKTIIYRIFFDRDNF